VTAEQIDDLLASPARGGEESVAAIRIPGVQNPH
jgi:hypothetical protein